MRKYFSRAALVVVMLATALLFVHFRAFGQETKPSDPIFGTWVMDVGKSFSKRLDEQPTFATQHIRILAPEAMASETLSITVPTSRHTLTRANSTVKNTLVRPTTTIGC